MFFFSFSVADYYTLLIGKGLPNNDTVESSFYADSNTGTFYWNNNAVWTEIMPLSGNVKKFGAIGNGIADDTEAFKKALDSLDLVYVPNGNYLITESIELSDYQSIIGYSKVNSTIPQVGGGSRLIFQGGDGSSAFINESGDTSIQNVVIQDIGIYVEGNYDWIFEIQNPIGWDFIDVNIFTPETDVGGISFTKTQQISWVNNFQNVSLTIPTNSTRQNMYNESGDYTMQGGNFSGGLGCVLAGTGGEKIIGVRFDNTSGATNSAGLNIIQKTEGRQLNIVGCQIENNPNHDIILDADFTDTFDRFHVIISSNSFRSVNQSAIYFKNNTGNNVEGSIVSLNSFNSPTLGNHIEIDTNKWKQSNIDLNYFR